MNVFAADPAPPAPASVTVTVPAVATTATDGLRPVLRAGRTTVRVPALLTVPGPRVPAWLEVNGVRGTAVHLTQGSPQRVATDFVATPGAAVTVRLVAGNGVVAAWKHTVSR